MTELAKLSACPFCGGEARFYQGIDSQLWPDRNDPMYWVACAACEAGSPPTHDRERAITAWNTRTGQLVERDGVAGALMPVIERAVRAGARGSHHVETIMANFRPLILTAIKGGGDAKPDCTDGWHRTLVIYQSTGSCPTCGVKFP